MTPPRAYPAGFTRWWGIYSDCLRLCKRKPQGKYQAAQQWDRLKLEPHGAALDKVLEEWYAEYRYAHAHQEFMPALPDAHRYLRDRRYHDQTDPPRGPQEAPESTNDDIAGVIRAVQDKALEVGWIKPELHQYRSTLILAARDIANNRAPGPLTPDRVLELAGERAARLRG